MGKSAPTPPPAPDPTTVINASANANDASALTQSKLNNVNYSGPQGTTTYNYDPGSGQFTQNVLLNPTLSAANAAYQYDQRLGANVAGEALDAARSSLGKPLPPPQLTQSVSGGPIQRGYDQGGQIQQSIQNTPVQTGFGDSGAIQSGIANPGSIQGQVAPTYSPYGALALGQGQSAPPQAQQAPPTSQQEPTAQQPAAPDASQSVNGITLAQQMDPSYTNSLASRVAIAQQPGHANYLAAINAAGGVQAYEAQQLQKMGYSPQAQAASTAPPQAAPAPAPQQQQGQPQGQTDPYAAIASNPVASTQLATYAQARQMLDPQWQQASEQQQAQLVAQGLNPNSAAYQNSMQLFGNQQNQAYNAALYGAINAGDQEQNTLYGQNLASGQFANAAQNQNYTQLMGQADLGNSAQLQNYNEQLGRAQLYNSANGQAFGQNLAQGQYGLAAQSQQNAENAAAAGFSNTAQSQSYQQQLANAQLLNSAAQQNFQNQAYVNNQPINNFNALMSSSQVGMPPSAPAQNTQVAPTNGLGAYQLQSGAQQDDYDQQMKAYDTSLSGLYGLGSTALGRVSFTKTS